MPWNPLERAALVDALVAAGPAGPTLCDGWRARHLAAHVVLRESTALTAAGIVVPALHDRTERVTRSSGEEAATPVAFAALVEKVRRGPPRWHPLRYAGDAAQLVELYIHTEDVRRAGPDGAEVSPRTRTTEHDDALWSGLVRMAGRLYRSTGQRIVLSDGTDHRQVVGRDGAAEVVINGPVGELLLHAYGRGRVARVTLDGGAEAVAAVARRR